MAVSLIAIIISTASHDLLPTECPTGVSSELGESQEGEEGWRQMGEPPNYGRNIIMGVCSDCSNMSFEFNNQSLLWESSLRLHPHHAPSQSSHDNGPSFNLLPQDRVVHPLDDDDYDPGDLK